MFTGDSLDALYLFLNKQASAASAASHAVEVSGLRHSLERAEGELGRVQKQLEDNQGMQKPCLLSTND